MIKYFTDKIKQLEEQRLELDYQFYENPYDVNDLWSKYSEIQARILKLQLFTRNLYTPNV